MIILDPVAISDSTLSRASTGTYFDKAGVMQTAVANALRVTYNPADLTAAPYALIEPEATNMALYSRQLENGYWAKYLCTVTTEAAQGLDGVAYMDVLTATSPGSAVVYRSGATSGTSVLSAVFRKGTCSTALLAVDTVGSAQFSLITGLVTVVGGGTCKLTKLGADLYLFEFAYTVGFSAVVNIGMNNAVIGDTIGVSDIQVEAGTHATSRIVTTGAPVARAADIISTSGTFLASNVLETDAAPYNAGTTYAAGQQVISSHLIYESKVAANLGAPVTDTTKWLLIGATNQRKMVDAMNNSQTANADLILLAMTPRVIAQGVYLGNLDANEVRVSMVDANDGLVYTQTHSLVISNSESSFFNWFFKRIRRKTYFFTGAMPVYSSAVVTIAIIKTGSAAKCGMCCVGPLIDVGLSQYGLATEIKDYSSTTFSFDGTSATVVRGYSKRMSIDISIDNELIDSVQEQLADFRQKPVVFVGAAMYGSAIVYGKYSSFKNVIESFPWSKMALQIEGMV